jgi:hypothetical protein
MSMRVPTRTSLNRRASSQAPLPPADIMPMAKLEAHLAIDTERFEANRLVQGHACRVRERDAGERRVKAATRQFRQQN